MKIITELVIFKAKQPPQHARQIATLLRLGLPPPQKYILGGRVKGFNYCKYLTYFSRVSNQKLRPKLKYFS